MAKDELDERLEELKRETGDEERHRREASDLDAAVAGDFAQGDTGGAGDGGGTTSEPPAAETSVAPTAVVDRESAPEAEPIPDEESSERAFGGDAGFGPGSESRLLSFYDRLRDRITDAVEQRGGRFGPQATRALLLVPDVFILMVRLALDRDVPASTRAMIGGALAYFILPVDLLPEAVIGAGGFLDDLVLASAVLAQAFSGDLEPYARKHWSGREDLRKVLGDVAEAAQGLLGRNLYDKVQNLLRKRGIRVEDARR